MKNLQNIGLLILLSLGAIGCNSNLADYYTGGGLQCGGPFPNSTQDPLPTNLSQTPGYSSVDWNDLAATANENGTFAYITTNEFFYYDTTQFEIELSDNQNTAQTGPPIPNYSEGIDCVLNYSGLQSLAVTAQSNQLVNALAYSNNTWTATTETLGWSLANLTLATTATINNGAAATPPTPPSNPITITTASSLENLFQYCTGTGTNCVPFSQASTANVTNTLLLWCNGSCTSLDLLKHYEIHASSISNVAPFNQNQLAVFFTWTANPTSAVASVQLGQMFINAIGFKN